MKENCNRPVLLPIPDDAPVMTIVLPSRRLPIAEAMVRRAICQVLVVCGTDGFVPARVVVPIADEHR